jgi:hypothetical protein
MDLIAKLPQVSAGAMSWGARIWGLAAVGLRAGGIACVRVRVRWSPWGPSHDAQAPRQRQPQHPTRELRQQRARGQLPAQQATGSGSRRQPDVGRCGSMWVGACVTKGRWVSPQLAAMIYRRSYRGGEYLPPSYKLDWAANLSHMMGACRLPAVASVWPGCRAPALAEAKGLGASRLWLWPRLESPVRAPGRRCQAGVTLPGAQASRTRAAWR